MKSSDIIQEVTTSILAVIAVLGTFLIVAFELVNSKPLTVPDVFSLLVGAVVGAYFGKTLSQNGARQAGTAAAQTAVIAANTAVGARINAANNPTTPS
jgi:hydrogenase/urease accessory protein HupE